MSKRRKHKAAGAPVSASPYERLGGMDTIRAAVERFYQSVLADEELAPFFEGVRMSWLRESQAAFLAQALGGPEQYQGRTMKAAHARLGIERRHFDLVAGHLVTTLDDLGIAQETIGEVVAAVTPLVDEIVSVNAATPEPESTERRPDMTPQDASTSTQSPIDRLEAAGMGAAILNSLHGNVIICDTDFQLMFANEKAVETLKSIEPALVEQFGVRVSEIVGGSIHRFHQNPAYNERILRDPGQLPRSAEFSFGDVTLMTHINALSTPSGETVGYIVAWTDETQRKAAESEQARIHSIVENAPINIMCADKSGTIMYMNPASMRTLSAIQHLLPVPVTQVVGAKIDIFHKSPELQRRIISDPANLPHNAQIQLADETLDLLVSPMYGADGDYLGPMVTWEVITERLRVAREVQEAKEREESHARELAEKVDSMLSVVEAAAEGDLTREVTVSGSDAIGRMGEGLHRFLQELRGSISQINESSQSLAGASEELSSISQTMGSSSEETSAQATVVSEASEAVSINVQTVASGTEEMTASIREIAQNANTAARVATEAVRVAEDTNVTVGKLGESSAEIGQVIKVITSIAQQTNLLALNATIEAARAGDAGKGFAVVANEVKELAKETAKATEDISRKIEAIQADTKESVTAIERIGEIIGQINDIQGTIASAVEEQTATTNEMAQNVGTASGGLAEIVENIKSVATAAVDTSSGASDTQKAAAELAHLASNLQSLVGRFHYED